MTETTDISFRLEREAVVLESYNYLQSAGLIREGLAELTTLRLSLAQANEQVRLGRKARLLEGQERCPGACEYRGLTLALAQAEAGMERLRELQRQRIVGMATDCLQTVQKAEDRAAQAEAGNKGLSAALKRLLVKYVNCARAHGNDDETINDSARFATDALSASPRDGLEDLGKED